MEEYLPFRASRPSGKFALDDIDAALAGKLSGALTASGTMEVCRRLGVRCAVSGGIGGIGDVKGEELCPDLPALRDLPVALVCTSPKDMLDIPATIGWLRNAGAVRTLGCGSAVCTGYVFNGEPVALDGEWNGEKCAPRTLILRGIAPELRLKDRGILARAVAEGKEAERAGRYYHPTVKRRARQNVRRIFVEDTARLADKQRPLCREADGSRVTAQKFNRTDIIFGRDVPARSVPSFIYRVDCAVSGPVPRAAERGFRRCGSFTARRFLFAICRIVLVK